MHRESTPGSASPNGRIAREGNKMNINDQMLSKKHLLKVKDDVAKLKQVVTDMNISVMEHHHRIKAQLVDDTKLNITVELLETAVSERIQQAVAAVEHRLKPKIKKRFKEKEFKKYLEQKAGRIEFHKAIAGLYEKTDQLQHQFDYGAPTAMNHKIEAIGERKADQAFVEEQLSEKIDKAMFDALLDRMNKLEEVITSRRMSIKSPGTGKGKSQVSNSPLVDEDPDSPDSIKKKPDLDAEEVEEDDPVMAEESDEQRGRSKEEMEGFKKKLEEQDNKY